MTRAAYCIGRILAALGALSIVATFIMTVISVVNIDNCQGADCDEVAFNQAMNRGLVLLAICVFVGAAGVALVNDTYRKV
jgi:hypothetical protein